MTKTEITSILKNISDSYQTDNTVTKFNINDRGKCFSIGVKVGAIYCGKIYCNCIRIDNASYIDFIDDGKMIAFLDYSFIENIDLL